MKYSKSISLLVLIFMLTSCYHATIVTDKNPSTQVIEKPWASGFLFGLVPPSTVETASKCPNGVAMVETKHSFLNELVTGITFSLYTPMDIKVTCAAGSGSAILEINSEDIIIPKNATEEEKNEVFQEASQKSFLSGHAIYVTVK